MSTETTSPATQASQPPTKPRSKRRGKARQSPPRKSPSKTRLKPKQALFFKNYTDPKSKTFGNAYRSALAAQYSEEYAKKITAVMSEKVSASMVEVMEQAGLTDERLVDVLKDGLEANRVVSVRIVKSRPSDSDDELAEANQNTDDFIEVPDHPTRHKFLDTAIKLKGAYAPEEHDHKGLPLIIEFVRPDGDSRKPQKDLPQTPPG